MAELEQHSNIIEVIDVEPRHYEMVQSVLARHLPYKEVWAYGSRVKWTASEVSDLDCVVFNATDSEVYNLKEAFDESSIPFIVQILNWESIPDDFKENIKKKYHILRRTSDWAECRLGDVVTFHYGKPLPAQQRMEGDIPVYSSAGLTGWHNKALIDNKGLIIGRKGTIGKVYKSLTPFFAIDTSYYILPDNEVYDFDYIFYLLSSIGLNKLNEDSAVPGLNRETAYSQLIKLPPLPEQKAIAGVLSSLDDKIDLLHRQNKTLEELAQTIFRQTFIENADDDWEERPLDKVANYLNGLACQKFPPKNDLDKLPVLKIKDLRTGITEASDFASTEVPEDYIIKNGDVIFSWSASLLVKIWDGQKCILNQHLFKVTSDEFPKWFIYLWTKHHLAKFISIAESKATTMGHIKRKDLSSSVVLIPDADTMIKLSTQIEPILNKFEKNNEQINLLEKQRDNLLPKLLSGEVRVTMEGANDQ